MRLRRDKKDGMFKPTLHSSKHLTYTKMRISKIEDIKWNN
ncbi:hypothetical protein TH5N_08800 [Tetragenococcus halophilus]|nr:hypothetical protein TH5N_08800 [Tetragenococcus halophilus]GEQ42175.1 hypothetical protein TH6N_08010 [Tetragenococcus halophilus]GEQ44509.1 hypothetical protein TH8N_08790 [Tetragenococcus halophilus]GEQ46767.1 hypothetical protein TH9N_08800 [Tetragenococcus halophilus]